MQRHCHAENADASKGVMGTQECLLGTCSNVRDRFHSSSFVKVKTELPEFQQNLDRPGIAVK